MSWSGQALERAVLKIMNCIGKARGKAESPKPPWGLRVRKEAGVTRSCGVGSGVGRAVG